MRLGNYGGRGEWRDNGFDLYFDYIYMGMILYFHSTNYEGLIR